MRAVRVAALSLLALLVCAAAALAVLPRKSAKFSGSGTVYFNDAPHWNKVPRTKEPLSFQTSSNGSRMLHFKGRFTYYCGSGTATVTAKFIDVSHSGRFSFRFKVAGSNSTYVSISGRFTRPGRASVSYLVDFVSPGQHIANPYDTSKPTSLGCASWVRGTAKVR